MITEQICKECRTNKSLKEFPHSSIHKVGRGKTCVQCLIDRRKKTPTGIARKMLRQLKNERKITPKAQRRKKEESMYQKVRKKMLDNMFEAYGFYFCQLSGETIPDRSLCQIHHIIYRSSCFDLELLHSERNLMILSRESHAYLHKNPTENALLAKERYLKNVDKK